MPVEVKSLVFAINSDINLVSPQKTNLVIFPVVCGFLHAFFCFDFLFCQFALIFFKLLCFAQSIWLISGGKLRFPPSISQIACAQHNNYKMSRLIGKIKNLNKKKPVKTKRRRPNDPRLFFSPNLS